MAVEFNHIGLWATTNSIVAPGSHCPLRWSSLPCNPKPLLSHMNHLSHTSTIASYTCAYRECSGIIFETLGYNKCLWIVKTLSVRSSKPTGSGSAKSKGLQAVPSSSQWPLAYCRGAGVCGGWERTRPRKQTFHGLHLLRAPDSGGPAGEGQPLALELNAYTTHLEDVISSARKASLSGHVPPKHKFIFNDFLVSSKV